MLALKTHHLQQSALAGSQMSSLSKINSEELVRLKNLLFSIISLSLDSLSNFIPNFADPNYLGKIDEYKLLLAFQLTPPSSFDSNSPLSFGSILWLIDYILKVLHRYDQTTSLANITNLPSNAQKQANAQSSTLTPSKRVKDLISGQQSSSLLADTSPKKNVSILVDESHLETKLPLKWLIEIFLI